jgi:tRNA/tmRNA/rRNA uracil-C5-methylase (TrmA/RlmC/RlmD family)
VIRKVEIAALAPTGEGVARTVEGVGFVAGALPGEEVEAEVLDRKRRFWRGRAVEVHRASPQRVSGPHVPCAACDWSHFSATAALEAKRDLFLETMKRIGGLDAERFGRLPAQPSPPGYRIRNRFHAAGRGKGAVLGWFSPRSHDVEPAEACEMLTRQMRDRLPRIREAVATSGAAVSEIATLESVDLTRATADVRLDPAAEQPPEAPEALAEAMAPLFDAVRIQGADAPGRGAAATTIALEIEGRSFSASPRTFFQANRFLTSQLYRDVRELAGDLPPGDALDAYGGVGLLAGALLDAGHRVVSVEGSPESTRAAARSRRHAGSGERWQVVGADVASFVSEEGDETSFDVVVADPPRAGLGRDLASRLATRARARLLYVSCDPATLARDLPAILEAGFAIADARLYDFYLFTHRIEALVALERRAPA